MGRRQQHKQPLPLIFFEFTGKVRFRPTKLRISIPSDLSIGSSVIFLLITGLVRDQSSEGLGGAIDLAMHLLRLDFVPAVKPLARDFQGKSKPICLLCREQDRIKIEI